MSGGFLAAAGLLYIAGVIGLASVLVGRGLGRWHMWAGWAVVWVLTTALVLLSSRPEVFPFAPVAVGVIVAVTVGMPTGFAVRYADRRLGISSARPWWVDAVFTGGVFLYSLVFTPIVILAIGYVRLGIGR